jgi:hypothetical protein
MCLAEHSDVSVMNRTYMGEMPGLNSSLDTDNPELLVPRFPLILLTNFGILPVNRPRLSVHCHLI